ncbi:MAG: acyl--CoA ligase [Rhodospirillaceae bacterium]|nr:acyl--CoA ligase [Rhodospirillaceae bacterium]
MGFAAARPFFPDYIALNAKWHGAKPAFICNDEILTWAQFYARMNQVARALAASGVRQRDTVGIVMDNSLPMAEVIWGIIAAGAVAVPLNTSVGDDGMLAMLTDAKVTAVVASGGYVLRIERIRAQLPGLKLCVAIDAQHDGWAAYSPWRDAQKSDDLEVVIASTDMCNIIYSSGTTGLPKGIVHTHQRRLDWAYDLAVALRYHVGSVFLVSIGMYSNIVWAGMLCTLIAGGTIVIMPKFDATQALGLMARYRVTNTAMVPLQYRLMLDVDDGVVDVSAAQALMSAGSPLWEDLKRDLLARFGATIIELYGLTEGLITTLAPEDAARKPASVGKPLLGTDIRIVDDAGCDVSVGEAGEIIGYGRFVMDEYLNRPEATSDVLMTDARGRPWLKTGDLGKLDDEGYLYIVGRKKDLILSGGQNIYPADIEAVAIKHPDVADVAVIAIPHEKWGETPLALIVPKMGAAADSDDLRSWINARVGKQQRVHAVELRTDLPRNPNGKLLKKELRAPYWAKA